MEELKKALSKLINFGETLEGALKDNRITLMEGVNCSAGLGMAIFYIIQNRKEIQLQLKQLQEDPQKQEELKQYIKDDLDLDNDRIEVIFERTLDLVTDIVAYIDAIKKS